MRVLHHERLQFRVPALELEVVPTQVANLSLQPPDLRLELPDLIGECVDGALLLVRLGRAVDGVAAEGVFKEPEERVGTLQVSLVNPPRH